MKKGRIVTQYEIGTRRRQLVSSITECDRCKTRNCRPEGHVRFCTNFTPPRDTFQLIELVLFHPQSLAKAFTKLLTTTGIVMNVKNYI